MSTPRFRPFTECGRYVVSDAGDVYRKRGETLRLLRPFVDTDGYLVATYYENGTRRKRRVHRLVAMAFIGPVPDGMETRHKNGIRTDNRAVNLCYGTHAENMQDAARHGTCPKQRLSVADVIDIRSNTVAGTVSGRHEIASRYGIAYATVQNIVAGRIWKHIDMPLVT